MSKDKKSNTVSAKSRKTAQTQHVWKKEYFEMLRAELERRKGDDVDITYREIRKNNGVYKNACTVRFHDAQVAPTVYLDAYYDHYLHGEAVSESAENILSYCKKKTPDVSFPPDFFRDYETVRGRLGIKLIGTQRNLELLREIPHIDYEDMSAVFFYLLEDPAFGNGIIMIRNTDMERWEKTTGELRSQALQNCSVLLPPVFRSLADVLEMFSPSASGEGDLYLLTNESALYGAAVLLYPGVLEQVSKQLGGSYFVLPSSVHEVILLPDHGEDPEELLEIVTEINHTQVAEEEILTDAVYKYEPGDSFIRKKA